MNANEIMPDWGRSVMTEYWLCLIKLCDYCLSGIHEGIERDGLNVVVHTIGGLLLLVAGACLLLMFFLTDFLVSVIYSTWHQFNRG